MPKRRPNILLITTDQHRADCYSFARRDIKTPHLDALAARGTRFERCYCPGPLCQPARASILTGMLPLTHGVRDNGIDLPDDMIGRGFAQQLADQGYRTALMGKAHLSTQFTFEATGRPECRKTMHKFYDDWFGPYMGFDYLELFIDGPVKWPDWEPPEGLHFTKWLFADGHGKEKHALYHSGERPRSGAQQTHISDLPVACHTSSWLGDRATDFIASHDNENDDPFMLWVSFPDPHHEFDAPDPYGRMYDPNQVDIPKHHDLDLSRRPWWHEAALTRTPKTTDEFRTVREKLSRQRRLTERQIRDITANYFGMISLVDHNVGRIMQALAEKGIADNTIVVMTSDHGEFLGDHGLLFKGPMFYDSLIRVGLIAAGPGINQGKVVNNVVSTVDLAPTLVEIGGGTFDGYHGQSLMPALSGGDVAAMRNMAHVEWGLDASRCGVDLDLRTVVTERYRYTVELTSGDGELYDLKNDPYEMDNLYYDAASKAVREEMETVRATRPDDIRAEPLPIVGMF
ncbi:MAG: sulfatase-like hydrolase/transferase [Rhodospirillales bacterium]